MSASKVFAIAELFESILAFLPQRDLLRAQQVSRRWNTFLTDSLLLQQKLFFQISTCLPAQEASEPEINPIIQETFPSFFDRWPPVQRAPVTKVDDFEEWDVQKDYGGALDPWTECESKRQAVFRPDASWRRMFPSSPAPILGQVTVWLNGCGCPPPPQKLDCRLGAEFQALNRRAGVYIGLLWDVVAFLLDDNPKGEFSVSWRRAVHGQTETESELVCDITYNSYGWDCMLQDNAYKEAGMKLIAGKVVEYPKFDDLEGGSKDAIAMPLSVRRRIDPDYRHITINFDSE